MHVVVVGAGIAGLAAAHELRRRAPAVRVTVVEGGDRIGGKLRVSEVGGVAVDEGAEMFLVRVPEAVELAGRLGLAAEVVNPVTTTAGVVVGGVSRPLPAGTVMGVPARPEAVREVLGPAAAQAVADEPAVPGEPLSGDVAVGAYVRERLGAVFVDRLVDPLLGGVYAGRADLLSLQATVPALFAALREHPSLVRAAAAALGQPGAAVGQRSGTPGGHSSAPGTRTGAVVGQPGAAGRPSGISDTHSSARGARTGAAGGQVSPAGGQVGVDGPVFGTLPRGLGTLPGAVLAGSGAELRLRLPVREIHRVGRGFRLVAGPVPDPTYLEADAVVVAAPASKAAPMLRPVAPSAAAELAGIDYASMAIVTAVYPEGTPPPGSADPPAPGGVRSPGTGGVGSPGAGGVRLPGAGGVRLPGAGGVRLPGIRSGLLVPAVEGRAVKALTFSSAKWAHLAGGPVVLRASVGRYGEPDVLHRDDADLVSLVLADVAALTGLTGPPLATRVTRWGGGLPQYAVGHPDRVRRIRAAVAAVPGLAVCGAAYDGVGVPACIRSAHAAVTQVLQALPAAGRIEP